MVRVSTVPLFDANATLVFLFVAALLPLFKENLQTRHLGNACTHIWTAGEDAVVQLVASLGVDIGMQILTHIALLMV